MPTDAPTAQDSASLEPRRRVVLPVVLFLATCLSTFWTGAMNWNPLAHLDAVQQAISVFEQNRHQGSLTAALDQALAVAQIKWQQGLIYMGGGDGPVAGARDGPLPDGLAAPDSRQLALLHSPAHRPVRHPRRGDRHGRLASKPARDVRPRPGRTVGRSGRDGADHVDRRQDAAGNAADGRRLRLSQSAAPPIYDRLASARLSRRRAN